VNLGAIRELLTSDSGDYDDDFAGQHPAQAEPGVSG